MYFYCCVYVFLLLCLCITYCYVLHIVMYYILLCMFCSLNSVFIVLFFVMFVCECVLYYCHLVATKLQLTYHIIYHTKSYHIYHHIIYIYINPLNPELNPICYLLALLGTHHFLHVSRIRVKLLTLRRLMSYIYIWSTHS